MKEITLPPFEGVEITAFMQDDQNSDDGLFWFPFSEVLTKLRKLEPKGPRLASSDSQIMSAAGHAPGETSWTMKLNDVSSKGRRTICDQPYLSQYGLIEYLTLVKSPIQDRVRDWVFYVAVPFAFQAARAAGARPTTPDVEMMTFEMMRKMLDGLIDHKKKLQEHDRELLEHDKEFAVVRRKQAELQQVQEEFSEQFYQVTKTAAELLTGERLGTAAYLNRIRDAYGFNSQELGKRATIHAKTKGVALQKTPHPVYGTCNVYPRWLLDEVYQQMVDEAENRQGLKL